MVQVANPTIRNQNIARRDRALWWRAVAGHYQAIVELLDTFATTDDEKMIRYRIRLLNNLDQSIRQIPCPSSAQDLFINLTQAATSLFQAYGALLKGDLETADQQSDSTVVCLIALQTELSIYDIAIG